MGVIYKLKPEIKKFILEKKQTKPGLGCRALALLAENKFKIKVSKSSINLIIKQAGLSLGVGRRRKRRRGVLQAQGLGAVLLKAADCLVGGSSYLTEVIRNRVGYPKQHLIAKTEYILYSPLFEASDVAALKHDCGLWPLINSRFTPGDISSYLNELQRVGALSLDIFKVISKVFQEISCVKVNLSDNNLFYLDGQLHTIWSTQRIPPDFFTTTYNINSYINKTFKEEEPLVLFMAPGYDIPTKEFFYFMSGLEAKEKMVTKLTLYDSKLEEVETISIDQGKRPGFVFGLWPWQFSAYRKAKLISEFGHLYFEPLKIDFYIAEAEVELLQPTINKRVTLKGCALKTKPEGKVQLIVLSNIPAEKLKAEELTNLYLNHWPNLDEAFRDFSRKIELFTYAINPQPFFSTQTLSLDKQAPNSITALFSYYLKALDLYVRRHFLPPEYESKDFPTTKEQFYGLNAKYKKQKNGILVTFQLPQGYAYLKELDYACRRVNEREITLSDGKRLWLTRQ